MEILKDIFLIFWPIMLAYLGYTHKRIYDMSKRLNKTLTSSEVEHLIDLKKLPQEVLQRETAQDIKEIKDKLDKLTERLLSSR